VTGDVGAETFKGVDAEKAIDALAAIPFGQKLYGRPPWRELQKRPGRLDPHDYSTHARRPPRSRRLLEDDIRGGARARQARRLPRDDGLPGRPRPLASGLRPR